VERESEGGRNTFWSFGGVPEGGPTFAKYPKRFLTLNFLGSGLALPILGY